MHTGRFYSGCFWLLMVYSTASKPPSMLSYVSMHTETGINVFWLEKKPGTSGFLGEFFSCKNTLMLKNAGKHGKPPQTSIFRLFLTKKNYFVLVKKKLQTRKNEKR
ncbi:unnamed protein product, partial [Staurois parvus]